jgi:MoxR-like ATPase
MAIDFATFTKVAPHVAAVRKPVLIRGRHGVGKSEIVYQTADGLGYPVVERRASQMTEGDLVGLPSTDGNTTSFNPPDWFKAACDGPVVLFLDEVDRATIEVRQGIFELTDSRKLNGHVLHKDTLIFAAVNGGEHGDQYQVGEMDPAELDRWTVFDVEPTVEDWLTWAKDKVDGVIWDFINQNRSHLEHTSDFEPNKVYPSRRSWVRLNDCFAQANLLAEDADTSILFPLANGFIGFEAAVSFKDFVDNYERQVTIENILDEGKVHLTERFGINDHNALVEKMEAKDIFSEELSESQMANLAAYFMTVPSEVGMKLWTVIGQGINDNVIALHGSSVDGRSISSHLVELMTGNSSEDE